MIVADTGAVVALIDADDRHHAVLREAFVAEPGLWVLPWAILPEVDYLLETRVGPKAEEAFLSDLASGGYSVEWGDEPDLARAHELCRKNRSSRLGLVDAVVIAVAERLRTRAIATLDIKHFGAVRIKGKPRLLPRDLPGGT